MGDKFCCCCSLKTGTLVYGYILHVFYLLSLIAIAKSRHNKDQISADIMGTRIVTHYKSNSDFKSSIYLLIFGLMNYVSTILLIHGTRKVLSAFTLIQNFVAISNSNDGSQYGIIGTLINIVSVVLLIYGATKEKKIFVLIFLIWDAIGLVIVTILVIVLGIVAPIIFIALPFIAISVYLWYNVLCYFIYLREKEIHGDVEGRMSDQPPAYDHK